MRRPYWRAIALVSVSLLQLALWHGATASSALARGESSPRVGLPGPVAGAPPAVGDTYNHFSGNSVSPGTSNTTVAQLNVPEGHYVVHANVNFTNSTNIQDLLNCAIVDTTGNTTFSYSLTSWTFSSDVLTFTTVLSVNASATVQLVCQVISPSSNKIAQGELTMTRIGAIQRQ